MRPLRLFMQGNTYACEQIHHVGAVIDLPVEDLASLERKAMAISMENLKAENTTTLANGQWPLPSIRHGYPAPQDPGIGSRP